MRVACHSRTTLRTHAPLRRAAGLPARPMSARPARVVVLPRVAERGVELPVGSLRPSRWALGATVPAAVNRCGYGCTPVAHFWPFSSKDKAPVEPKQNDQEAKQAAVVNADQTATSEPTETEKAVPVAATAAVTPASETTKELHRAHGHKKKFSQNMGDHPPVPDGRLLSRRPLIPSVRGKDGELLRATKETGTATARRRKMRLSQQRLNEILRPLRGLSVEEALIQLDLSKRPKARWVRQTIWNARQNAVMKEIDPSRLVICESLSLSLSVFCVCSVPAAFCLCFCLLSVCFL